ncbi:hypothetical protein I316_04276 [Kwoniella heveanensis BCC8398]|uniref:Phosphoglycerate dehydrogenase n=1 Tax=Kwoniella heveanensis BCC8398 TaxID=1296120 RepID=A0A1B9GSB9_9TREE|nr:hypothetical protein I316_04276 [Kwoniella heveanensis BCC8398]
MSAQPKPLVFALTPLYPQAQALATKHFNLVQPSDEGFDQWRQKADGLMTTSHPIKRQDVEIIKAEGKLKFVAKQGTGVDMIDLVAMRDLGVPVMNTPGINAQAVAELALGLIMDVARRISITHSRLSGGLPVSKADGLKGQTLFSKTLGLIGGGDTGFALARMFNAAFNAPIILFDPFLSVSDLQRWTRAIPAPLLNHVPSVDELLTQSDVVSLHCPLTTQTKGMISLPQLRAMKSTAVLVNVARGGIVDEGDLETALKENMIAGVGLDVTVIEPPTKERYGALCGAGNCVITPHYGAAPADVQEATCLAMVEHLIEAFDGHPLRDRVV